MNDQDDKVTALIAELKAGRREAARALGEIGDPQAVSALIEALKYGGLFWDGATAVEALVKIGPPAVPSLVQALKNEDWSVCRNTGEALAVIGAPAVPALMEALKDRDLIERAAEALGKIGDRRAVPALIGAVRDRDKNWGMRRHAIEALGTFGDAQAVPALVQALNCAEVMVTVQAVEALVKIGRHHPDPALRAALPALRRLQKRLPIFREALDEIAAATATFQDLPLPASAPPPDKRSLPRPAAAVPPGAPATPPLGFWVQLRRALRGS